MPARSLQEKEGISFIKSWRRLFGNKTHKSAPNIYTSLKFLTFVRCVYAVLVLIYSTLWLYSHSQFDEDINTHLLLGCVIEIFVFTAVCCVLLIKKRFIRPITYVSMLHDSLLAAAIVLLTGAHNSPFYYLFLIIPLYGGIILQKRGGIIGALIGCCVQLFVFGGIPQLATFLPYGTRELYELYLMGHSFSISKLLSLMVASLGVGVLTGQLAHQYVRVQSDLIETGREFSHLRGIYEIMLNALPVGIVISDPKTRRLLYANPSAKHLFELEKDDISIEKIFHPETFETELEVGSAWHHEYAGRYLSIAKFELSLDKDKQLNGYHISDITELHHAQLELVRRQRMELLGEFSAKVAHEIRNPLACISGCNEMLQCDVQTDEQKELLEMMGNEITRLNNLINDILLFSRRPKLSPCDLNLLETLNKRRNIFLNNAQNSEITVTLDIPSDFKCIADETSFTQIVMTLWRNSVEAMNGRGGIRVAISSDESAIQFYDDGPGLTDELVRHVFEPFYTTKASGTGLGLTIARQLSLDNGMILSWNKIDRCFDLMLPKDKTNEETSSE